jgi:murein DD-endopeptidase MepM/ murein hydrolase activator NlpD
VPTHPRRFVPDFGAPRKTKGRARFHVGEDLDGEPGDVVRSMEAGTVTATQTFAGPNAHAILVLGDSGTTVLYGEVDPASWVELGIRVGGRVERCQPIARIGINKWGSSMLHLETYAGRVRQNQRWFVGDPAPPALRNPRAYLERAAAAPDAPTPPTPGPPPPRPAPRPPPPPRPQPAKNGSGWLVLALVALALGYAHGRET